MSNKTSSSRSVTIDVQKLADSGLAIKFVVLIVLYTYLGPSVYWLLRGASVADFRFLNAIGSYLLIVGSLLIFGLDRFDTLRDHLSLWAIVLACGLSALLPATANNLIYRGAFVLLGITLSIYIIVNRKKLKTPGWKSVFVGLFWSMTAVAAVGLVNAWLMPKDMHSLLSNLPAPVFVITWFHLALIAVAEEGLFRGLILSFLTRSGCSKNKALFIQAVLFWGMHYLDAREPIFFWVILPLITLFLTLIIKKYRLLYLSVVLHTLVNVLLTLLGN